MAIIDKPNLHFETKLYTGTGSSNAITGVGFQPDLTWIKQRGGTTWHNLYDSVRGVTKSIASNDAYQEETRATGLTAFGSDGFTVGADNNVNGSSNTYASWNWKESATAGFDIVSYTGNGSARTLSHSLSAIPKMIIVKNLTSATSWHVYHNSIGATKYLQLNSSNAEGTASSVWNDTAPTSSVFSIGSGDGTNKNTDNIIAYLFAEKQGFSKFSSYIGNGNADGTFVYTGFKPAFVMVRNTVNNSRNWTIIDNKRNPFNPEDEWLYANASDSTFDASSFPTDFVSNGFKIRNTGSYFNTSGENYIYMAFAENPFVTSSGVCATAR